MMETKWHRFPHGAARCDSGIRGDYDLISSSLLPLVGVQTPGLERQSYCLGMHEAQLF